MERPKNSQRGTIDLLPPDSGKWLIVENLAKKIFAQAGFGEIKTPIFEATEVFTRAVGEASDIVNKEMYTFLDRSERSLTLRPEGTAGIVRAFLSNGMDRWAKPIKLWYLGPMFRYERSQTGRYRQFTQLGAEIFGSAEPSAELEGIYLIWTFFKELGLQNLSLEINSVGDNSSRAVYQKVMQKFLEEHKDKICPDCQRRSISNPLRALDCKVPEDASLYAQKAPLITDYLSEQSKVHHEKLMKLLTDFEIPFINNQNLVRGLDYYTNTVFEIKTSNSALGVQNTICAGGRYDNLVSEFGGQATPAFGFAIGMERLMLLCSENLAFSNLLDFTLIYPAGSFSEAFKIITKLRNKGFKAGLEYEGYASKSQSNKIFDRANTDNILFYKPQESVFLEWKSNSKKFRNIYEDENSFWTEINKFKEGVI